MKLRLTNNERGISLLETLVASAMAGFIGYLVIFENKLDKDTEKIEFLQVSRQDYYDTFINKVLGTPLIYIKDELLDPNRTLDRTLATAGGTFNHLANPARLDLQAAGIGGNARANFFVPDSHSLERFSFDSNTMAKLGKGYVVSRCIPTSEADSMIYDRVQSQKRQVYAYLNSTSVRYPIIQNTPTGVRIRCCPATNYNCTNDIYTQQNGATDQDAN